MQQKNTKKCRPAAQIARTVDFLSGQFILDYMGTNGGEVVVLRAIWLTFLAATASIGVQAWIDPCRPGPVSLLGLRHQLVDLGGLIAAFFGASYLALYSRFVSQWSYLANVYNMIKQAESSSGACPKVIAEWKAGYIEDADHLHLVEKRSVAPTIVNWGKIYGVRASFVNSTPGGAARLDGVLQRAEVACGGHASKH